MNDERRLAKNRAYNRRYKQTLLAQYQVLTGDKTSSLRCFECPAYATCDHEEHVKSVCRVCGKRDYCNTVRDGMCLDCYSHEWNTKHPVVRSVRFESLKEHHGRNE